MSTFRTSALAPPLVVETEALRARVVELESEREALLQQVLHLQRVAQGGLLTAGLSHDVLNQLTSLMGAAELALMQGYAGALREGLHASLRHGYRMHETVDAFLSFVRRREHRVRVFPVQDALENLQRLVERVARAEGVLLLQSCTTRASIRADRQLVEQVLVNLALNGVRAAAAGSGRVVISATDSDVGTVLIAVRDTGTGIREDVQRRLFQPFVTAHEEEGGTGLGLYVVRQVVQRYGGNITVESSSAGTRIEVELPVSEE